MPFDKNQYDSKYVKDHYDRLNIQVPKGDKELIEQHRKAKGYSSLNAYVNALIAADMGRKRP